MHRALLALALSLALGIPGLQWAAGLVEVALSSTAGTHAGGMFDPNGAHAGAGNIFDPNGAHRDAGNIFDPDGAHSDAGNHWDPDG
jgi:hypothetical protein